VQAQGLVRVREECAAMRTVVGDSEARIQSIMNNVALEQQNVQQALTATQQSLTQLREEVCFYCNYNSFV